MKETHCNRYYMHNYIHIVMHVVSIYTYLYIYYIHYTYMCVRKTKEKEAYIY